MQWRGHESGQLLAPRLRWDQTLAMLQASMKNASNGELSQPTTDLVLLNSLGALNGRFAIGIECDGHDLGASLTVLVVAFFHQFV